MTVYNIFMTVIDFYVGLIIIYVLMSWLPNKSGLLGDIDTALGRLCDPYLDIFKRIIPPMGGSGMSVDFSPILAILVLQVVGRFIGRFLLYL